MRERERKKSGILKWMDNASEYRYLHNKLIVLVIFLIIFIFTYAIDHPKRRH